MTSFQLPPALAPLVCYLDNLSGRPSLEELSGRLRRSKISLADVRPWIVFGDEGYRRNLVANGRWYDLLVLCWRSGQRSPIHDHAHSVCAFKVLTGICSETVYGFGPSGQAYPLHTVDQPEDSIVATQDADTHQVSNLQPPGTELVTVHIYSPPLEAMRTFSIFAEGAGAVRVSKPQDIIYGESI